MSRVLLINGSPNQHGCTYTALMELAGALEKRGVETELLYLGRGAVAGCTGCGACYRKGHCVVDDMVNKIGDRLDEFDGIVAGSPVYYSGPSSQICAFMDRLFFSNSGKMAGKLGAAVVSCRRGGASAAFDRLNKYFSISNMCVVGAQYWNQVHGNTPDEVRQDLEGMQTMRSLGENMAWLLQCIEAGRAAGVKPPEYEKGIFTNFIR